MHCGSLSRGPAITARLIRSGLSTNRTSELAHHEVDRPIDVRLPLRGHSSGVLPGCREELFAFGLNLCLGGAHDLAVTRLRLCLELFGQFERFSPRIPQGGLALSFRLFHHCSNLSLHLFDSLESFLFAHAERSGRTRLVFKGFRRVRNASEHLHVACDSHFYMSLFMIPSRCNSRSPVTHEKSIHLDAILRRKNAVVHNV